MCQENSVCVKSDKAVASLFNDITIVGFVTKLTIVCRVAIIILVLQWTWLLPLIFWLLSLLKLQMFLRLPRSPVVIGCCGYANTVEVSDCVGIPCFC